MLFGNHGILTSCFYIIYHVMFILYCLVFSTLVHLISFIVSISVFLDNLLYNFIFIYGCFSLKKTAYILLVYIYDTNCTYIKLFSQFLSNLGVIV